MKKGFSVLLLILFSLGLHSTVVSGRPYLKNKKIDENESYFKIANGFLELGDTDKAFFYAEKIRNYSYYLRLHYNIFEKYFSEGDIESAIAQLDTMSINDTIRFEKFSQPFRDSYLFNGVGIMVDYYLDNNSTKLALKFAKKYNDKNSISYIHLKQAEKYIEDEEFDKGLSYSDKLIQKDKDELLKDLSIQLMIHNQLNRSMDICSRIENDRIRDSAYMFIFKSNPIIGDDDHFRKQLSFLTTDSARDNFILYFAVSCANSGLYDQAEKLGKEIDDLQAQGIIHNKIFANIMQYEPLDKAVQFYFDHLSTIDSSYSIRELLKRICENNQYELAYEIAESDSSQTKKDFYYNEIVKCYLKDDNLPQVDYILNNLIEDPKQVYFDLCEYYCKKDNLEKAASFAGHFKNENHINKIYQIIAYQLCYKDRFDEAYKYAGFISNEHSKNKLINTIDRRKKNKNSTE